jgi:hypothetical protein
MPSAQTRGGCAALETPAGHQPQSFGRRANGGRAPRESRVTGRLKLLMNFGGRRDGYPARGQSILEWSGSWVNHLPHGITLGREVVAVAVAQIDGNPVVRDRLV